MKTLNKLNRLIYQLGIQKEKTILIEIEERILSLINYIILVVKKEAEEHINLETNEVTEEEIEQEYEKCIENIKYLDCLSNKVLGEIFYTGKLSDKEEVEKFLQDLINEIFDNRKISRR